MRFLAFLSLLTACGGKLAPQPVECVVPDAEPVTCEAQDFYVFTPATVDDGGISHSTGSQCGMIGCPHGDTCEAKIGAYFVEGVCP